MNVKGRKSKVESQKVECQMSNIERQESKVRTSNIQYQSEMVFPDSGLSTFRLPKNNEDIGRDK